MTGRCAHTNTKRQTHYLRHSLRSLGGDNLYQYLKNKLFTILYYLAANGSQPGHSKEAVVKTSTIISTVQGCFSMNSYTFIHYTGNLYQSYIIDKKTAVTRKAHNATIVKFTQMTPG